MSRAEVRIRVIGAIFALAAGVGALVVAIELVRDALG